MEQVKVVALTVKKSEYFQVNAFWESVHYQYMPTKCNETAAEL